ncbi:MAG: two-component sensor histidine kinase [Acidobacteria bacterium]|nr:MAG: two-component sensor histidine kinase [Acidobacteriota bacterium]
MRITRRTKAIAFFIALGTCLVALATALNVSWMIFHWRQVVPLVLGSILFGLLIAGLVMNTIFLVREIRRNEQQDSFLNAITHELKTPITSIRLYLETLESRRLDDTQRRDFYRIMLEDTDRLLGTVEQVLRASQVRHRSLRENWQGVNFTEIVNDVLELTRLRQHLSASSLYLSSERTDEITVMGSAEELRTAVFNLFDNAVKYSGKEKNIAVDISTPNLDTVSLRVCDNGVGIQPKELKRIFKRFYRAPNSMAGQVNGTGLGLFIVRSIARRHGGDAYAESKGEGLGSTFTMRLPRIYRA